jgi:class 3 adenylate cyclase
MRRTTTASLLFCDLVESTELQSQLGDTNADEVRRSLLEALHDAARTHHGRVVKNLGDGLMAAFGSAVDAVGAAVAMQRATSRLARLRSLPLQLRVGLSAGEVSEEDSDYFGTPVVEAARLCAAAEPGRILAADVVRALIGSRSPAPILAAGTRELKGLAEPVVTVEVEWTAVAWSSPCLPSLPTGGRRSSAVCLSSRS